MERFFFESDEALADAGHRLSKLNATSRKILAEAISEQVITRTAISKAISALEDEGFLNVRDDSTLYEKKITIRPTLAGEEASEYLDEQSDAAPKRGSKKTI